MTDAGHVLPQSAPLPAAEPAAPAEPMSRRTRFGLMILGGAVLLGVLADLVFRVLPWGLNVPVWTIAFAAVAWLVGTRFDARAPLVRLWPVGAAVLFSLGVAWRDSTTLKLLDILAMFVVVAWLVLPSPGRFLRLGIADHVWAGVAAGFDAAFGAFWLLLSQIGWREVQRDPSSRHGFAALRGILIALPLLLLFGGLLMAADAAFQSIVTRLLRINVFELIVHGVVVACLSWGFAGFLHAALLTENRPGYPLAEARWLTLGGVETAIVLGLLDALFAGFVAVQSRYFFGGAALVEASVNLTYAQYARAGFFELVWVATLVLPMLLGFHWLLRPDDRRGQRLYRVLAAIQVVLLVVIMVSALQRMRLYQEEFGLTELRLYTTAFMGWLGLVFLWFAGTVLRERRELFAVGAVASAAAVLVGLHVLNPDAFIVEVNVARGVPMVGSNTVRPVPIAAQAGQAAAGRERLDPVYLTSLSADAVPPLVAALPSLSPELAAPVRRYLHDRWLRPESVDWRSWNVARELAWQATDGVTNLREPERGQAVPTPRR